MAVASVFLGARLARVVRGGPRDRRPLALRLRRRLPAWAWLVPLALLVRGLFLDSWWYTLVGDEYEFREMAAEIVRNQTLPEIGTRLFGMEGVYGQFTDLTSLVQAAGMFFAGTDNFGWKISSLFLSALAIPFYFSFFRTFAGRRVATFACFLLAVSHYLMSFVKIGYPNLPHLTVALLVSAAAWAVRTRRTLAFTRVGLAAGACCYVYPAALYCLCSRRFSPRTSRRRTSCRRRAWPASTRGSRRSSTARRRTQEIGRPIPSATSSS
ncbi:MAG: hypothetical protein LC796_00975 [Acidobacteria bacterium]|nr:hypothetical protein [Acidobacteriota bacterium]